MQHPTIKDGWFHESNAFWPGQTTSLQVEAILHTEKSDFQDVMVFKSTHHGNVLVLDSVVQASEKDECSYQEMMAHLPICAHGSAKKVIINPLNIS
jgi:spermidine synthase